MRPVPQPQVRSDLPEEYYKIFSFINNTFEAQSQLYTKEDREKIGQIRQRISQSVDEIKKQKPNWQTDLTTWMKSILDSQPKWHPLKANLLETISGLTHPTQEADLSVLMLGHTNGEMFMLTSSNLDTATGLRLEILNHGDLPFNGPGRNHLGMWGVSEIELLVQKPNSTEWEKIKLIHPTADFSEPETGLWMTKTNRARKLQVPSRLSWMAPTRRYGEQIEG